MHGRSLAAYRRHSLRLAVLTSLRLVLELFVVEEKLLACCKDEVPTAVNALEDLVLEFHVVAPVQTVGLAMDRTHPLQTPMSGHSQFVFGPCFLLPL
jgi:hypothetical protein